MTIFAVNQVRQMPVDVFPEFAPPKVEVQTISLGLSATDVEELVTVPLENALNGVPGLDVMRSKSVPGLSSVRLLFPAPPVPVMPMTGTRLSSSAHFLRSGSILSGRSIESSRSVSVRPIRP